MTRYGTMTRPVSDDLAQTMRLWRVCQGVEGWMEVNSDSCHFPFEHSSIRAIWTFRREPEPPGTYLNANRLESGSSESAIQSGGIDQHHRIAQVDDAHQHGWQAVHTRENPSGSEDSMRFDE
jgi:Zn-dependent M28 family amino/carboxypeptidase